MSAIAPYMVFTSLALELAKAGRLVLVPDRCFGRHHRWTSSSWAAESAPLS